MAQVLCDSLLDNYRKAIALVAEVTRQFDREEWRRGINFFQVPSKIAFHIVDTMDFFFRENPDDGYQWGHRFGGAWWQLSDDAQPSQEAVLEYLSEIEERIVQHFSWLDDASLVTPYDTKKEHGDTRLGHYVYALRHTMHHHGAFSLLALHYGHQEGTWA